MTKECHDLRSEVVNRLASLTCWLGFLIFDLVLEQWYILVSIRTPLPTHSPLLPTAGTHLAHYELDDDLIVTTQYTQGQNSKSRKTK